jgi:glycosyltransferase involved in cell wall biosynthesis
VRVLAISYALPPALYPQAIQVGRLLARCDGEIGAVCGPLTNRAVLDHDLDLAERLAFRLEVAFQPKFKGLAFGVARRLLPFYARIPDEFRAWVPLAETAVLARLQRSRFAPDVIVTFGEPMSDHLLGLRLKAKFNLPWIAHFSDPWSDNPFRRHNILANVVNRRLERRVIAAADRLIFTSPETVDLVMRKYPMEWRQKCFVLPHNFDPSLYPARIRRQSHLMARYIGNFYGHRTPLPLFDALHSILRDQPAMLSDVRFELVGQTPAWVSWHRALRSLPDKLIRLLPTVPYSESLKLMVESDLLLVIDAPDDLSVFLPSKLIEYIGAGVPICGIVPPGTSANVLRRLGGPTADPRDTKKVAAALLRVLGLARERSTEATLPPWGDSNVRSNYMLDRVAKDFSRILADAASTSQ